MWRRLVALLLALCLALPALAQETPYRQRVKRADEAIFAGPCYDESCVGTVHEAGVYTIVEEVDDGEGHLWGRLKSGAGWLDLTHVRSEEVAARPVSAAFREHCPPEGPFRFFTMPVDEFTVEMIFRVAETVTDVRFVALELVEEGFAVGETLCAAPELSPDCPLVTGVTFWGDMTTYGLLCTDAAGQQRLFAAYISGRNGMLVLEEWGMTLLPDGRCLVTEEAP